MTDYNNNFAGTEPFSLQSYQLGLAGTVLSSQTLPGSSEVTYRVEFSFPYNANVWVGLNSIPILPTEGVISTNPYCALNPKVRYARGGDTLNFISGSAVTDAGFELLTIFK